MEKISFNNQHVSSPLYQQLKNDPEVVQMLDQKGLKAEDMELKAVAVKNWLDQKHLCANCEGLKYCRSQSDGYTLQLNESLDEMLVPCHYLEERLQKTEHRKNYLLCDLNEKALENDIYKIDLTNESNNYRQIVSMIKQWLEEGIVDKGLYFHGGLGVGKTYLASCISNFYARKGSKVAFVNMPKLASDLRNNLREYDYVNSRLSRMRKADLLVLDDIGAENITDWIRDDILFTVLDYRMENEKLTVFTSNSDLEALKRRMMTSSTSEDEVKALRIIERIRALSTVVRITGTSRRSL